MTVRDMLNELDHEVWVRVEPETRKTGLMVWSADWHCDAYLPKGFGKYTGWEVNDVYTEIGKNPETGEPAAILVIPAVKPERRRAMRTSDRRYPQCRCARFGQSRFGPVKRTALDGVVWWVMFDYAKGEYVPWYVKFETRRKALVQLAIDFRHGRIPYEPDPGFSKDWLLKRTAPEITYLIDHRRLKDETD